MTKSKIAQRNDVETSEQPPKPSAESKRLNVLVGKWNTEGQRYEGPVGRPQRSLPWKPMSG